MADTTVTLNDRHNFKVPRISVVAASESKITFAEGGGSPGLNLPVRGSCIVEVCPSGDIWVHSTVALAATDGYPIAALEKWRIWVANGDVLYFQAQTADTTVDIFQMQ